MQFNDISISGHPKSIDLSEKPVTIGDDAWMGAGAVVTRNVPAATIVAGNPAAVIRALTPQELA